MMADPTAASYVARPFGEGTHYDWENDHTVVKVSARETSSASTLMEDTLMGGFSLGLHRHNRSAQTFFRDGDWCVAEAGTTLHVPPGVPHAVHASGKTARMLMIMQPAGCDLFLTEMAQFSDAEVEDQTRMAALSATYDIENQGLVPPHPDD